MLSSEGVPDKIPVSGSNIIPAGTWGVIVNVVNPEEGTIGIISLPTTASWEEGVYFKTA